MYGLLVNAALVMIYGGFLAAAIGAWLYLFWTMRNRH